MLANVIQLSAHHKVNEDYTTWEKRRFRPGDVAVAGTQCSDVRNPNCSDVLFFMSVLPYYRESQYSQQVFLAKYEVYY